MATLTGRKISDTYKDLLQVSNSNAGVDGTLRDVEDGEGTASVLQISSSAINISSVGALQYGGTAITSTAAELNILDGVTATTAELNYLDGADANINTLTLPASTTISAFGATIIDDADASAARTTLGVDAAGTDNSTDVTLVTTSHDYLSLSGQAITLGQIDISDDTNLVAGSDITLSGDTLNVDDSFLRNDADDETTGKLTAAEFIGDLRGAVRFRAKADVALTKGDAVYVSGIDGNTPTVGLADANDTTKMPSFGLASSSVSANANVEIVTFGTLSSIDTDTPAFDAGDVLYISTTGTTGNTLTNTPPTGESSLIQNIGKVQRRHASAGSIKVGGAGRSNATGNLDDGNIFIGNASNQAVTASLNTKIESYLDAGTSTPNFSSISIGGTTLDSDIATLSLPSNTTISAFGKTIIDDLDASAVRTTIGVDAAGTDNSTDVTLANTNYLSISGQEITGGTVPIGSGGTGATTASAARTALGVDPAGTDNSTPVTLSGTLDYLTLSGQQITRNAINLTTDVTGTLPVSQGGTGQTSLDNFIELGTMTVGNYAASVAGTTNEIEVTGSAGEGTAFTIGLPADVVISNSLTVNGTTTTIDTQNLIVEDPLIKLAKTNNAADSVDIGFYGLYDTAGTDKYAGLFRDANDSGKFKLFKDLQDEPTTTVDVAGTGYAKATLVADLEGNVTGNATGNAGTATALATGRDINITGDVTGTTSTLFDGTGDATINVAMADNSVDLGTHTTGNYVASLTAGNLIDLQNNTGEGATPTIDVDLSELVTSTSDADGDFFAVVDSANAQKKLTKGNINISGFNNDSGFTSNAGTVTSVTVTGGDGLTGGGSAITSSGTVTLAVGSDTLSVGADKVDIAASALTAVQTVEGADGFIFFDNSDSDNARLGTVSDLPFTNNAGTITSVSVTAGTGLSGGGSASSGGFSATLDVSGLTVSELAASSLTTSAEAFADNDTTLMTSAAINDRIESFGYTTNTGDITSVVAGTGLSGGNTSGDATLNLDISGLNTINESQTSAASDTILVYDNDANEHKQMTLEDLEDAIGGTGTVTNVVAGNGLSGGGTVTATLDLDFSELTDMTSDISGTTEFILQDGTTESRKAASEIKLTAFDATGFSSGISFNGSTANGLLTYGNSTTADVESNLTFDGDFKVTGTLSSLETINFDQASGDTVVKISGTGNQRLEFADTATGANAWIGIPSWNDDAVYIFGPTSTGNEQAWLYESSTHRFNTGSSEQLAIFSNGAISMSGYSVADRHLEIGSSRQANGYAYIDLIGDTTYTDFGARFIRENGGPNTGTAIEHRGTGVLSLNAKDAGSVRFYTSNTERVRIDSSGNVSIGNISASRPLQIGFTTTNGEAIKLDGNASYGASIYYSRGGSYNWNAGVGGASSSSSNIPASYWGIEDVSQGNAVRLAIAHTTGNVGIGTNSPDAKLEVNGSTNSDLFSLEGAGSSFKLIAESGSTGSADIMAYRLGLRYGSNDNGFIDFYRGPDGATGYLAFGASGSEAMRLDRFGKLGIGTNSPLEELDINGSLKVRGDSAAATEVLELGQFASPNGTTPQYTFNTYDSAGGLPSAGDHLEIRSVRWGQSISFSRNGQGGAVPTALFYNGNSNGYMELYKATNPTTDATYTTQVKLNVNGDSYLNGGNVGIGTAGPQRKLHVSTGNTDIAARFENTSSNGTVMELLASGDSTTMYFQTDHIYSSSNLYLGAGTKITHYRASEHRFQYGSSNTESVRIASNGRLIVGSNYTTNASTQLVVSSSGANGLLLNNDAGATANSGRLFFEGTSTSAIFQEGNDLSFRTGATTGSSSGTERMKIDTSGNVKLPNDGVSLYLGAGDDLRLLHSGTESYVYSYSGPLYVGAVSTDQDVFIRGNDGGASINAVQFDMSDAGTAIFNHDIRLLDNARYYLGTGNDFQMFHDGTNTSIENLTGNLYITEHTNDGDIIFRCDDGAGGVTPYITLDGSTTQITNHKLTNFNGDIYLADDQTLYVGTDTTNGLRLFHLSSNNNNYVRSNGGALSVETMAAQPIYFNTNSTSAMAIDSSQNVGIGTSSPSFKLKVNVDNGTYTDWETIAAFQTKRGADTEYEAGLMISSLGDALGGQISSNYYWTDNVGARGNTGRSAGIFGIANSTTTNSEFYWQTTPHNSNTLTTRMELDGATSTLHVDGDVVAYSTTVSDKRLKDNVETIDNALGKVMKLRGVEFDWIGASRKGQHDIGLIAQEVEEVIPEIVREKEFKVGEFTDNKQTFKTVDYDKMVGVLIEAIKEQQQQINELKEKLNG